MRVALVAVFAVACSSSEPPPPEVLRSCPPAPLWSWSTSRCEFAGSCRYATPTGLLADRPDGCNPANCSCEDGEFVCFQHAIGCSAPSTVRCADAVVDGLSCTLATNAECEKVAAEKRYVCACDNPGPKWRCVART